LINRAGAGSGVGWWSSSTQPCGSITWRQPEPGDTVAGSGTARQRLGLTDLIFAKYCKVFGSRARSRGPTDLLKFQVFETGAGAWRLRPSELPRLAPARLHRSQDHRLPHATFCLQGRHELLHRDHDFDCFEKVLGLQVLHAAGEPLAHTSFTGSGFVLKFGDEIRVNVPTNWPRRHKRAACR